MHSPCTQYPTSEAATPLANPKHSGALFLLPRENWDVIYQCVVQARYNVYKPEGKHGEGFHLTRQASGKRIKDNKEIENLGLNAFSSSIGKYGTCCLSACKLINNAYPTRPS